MNQSIENNKAVSTISTGGKRLSSRSESPRPGKKVAAAAILAIAVLILAGILVWATFIYDGIYPNVMFAGMNIGGLSREKAKAAIESVLDTYADEVIEVSYADEVRIISVLEAGAVMSSADALQAAIDIGRTGSVFSRFGGVVSSLFTKREVLLETETNIQHVKEFLASFSDIVKTEKVETSYQILPASIRIDMGIDGKELDIDSAAQSIADRIITKDLQPVRLEDFILYNKVSPLNLLDVYNEVYLEESDAYLDDYGNEMRIVPSVRGTRFDLSQAQQTVEAQGKEGETLYIPLITTEPEITTKEFEAMLFRDELVFVKTTLNASNLNRTGNVRLAANAMNGTILLPGEVFSYNDTLGERTYANGYKDASVYTSDGIEDQLGGGICQGSSTLYMAIIRVGLEIVERYNHSYTVVYAPLGEDATVYWGSLDFKFSNNRKFPIKIEAYQKDDYIVVRLLGTKTDNNTTEIVTNTLSHTPYETKTVNNSNLNYGISKVKTEGHSAYRVESFRVVYDENGKEISREKLPKSTYRKLDKVVEVGTKGAPQSTVAPTSTVNPSALVTESPSVSPSESAPPTSSPSELPSASPSPSASPTESPSESPSVPPEDTPTEDTGD